MKKQGKRSKKKHLSKEAFRKIRYKQNMWRVYKHTGHNYTLVKKQSRLDVRKYSFSQRTINVWNNLSADCVHASSVNMFKNKIDKYLVEAGYT